jgi:hypothetical protein
VYAVPADTAGVTVAGPWRGMGLAWQRAGADALRATVPQTYRLGKSGAGFELLVG